ncbi:MAG TPA: DUF1552 domain-containing protein [Woeseiaceae bacterium]|nr:DUF1552 domain-containing protein [Woeseiaceae bacterium]
MILRKKHISRRMLLRGVGATLALPFLDAMHPALSAERDTAAAPIRRLGIVYYPHGVVYEKWTPTGTGGPLVITAGLKPLERHKENLVVVAGLTSSPDRTQADFHDRAMASWLTGQELTRGTVHVGVSVDQVAAAKLGQETQLSSLELEIEDGSHHQGPSFRDATTVLPSERNPRVVFERLFGEGGKIDPVAIAARDARDKSALDAVRERISALKRQLGPADVRTLDQYLESIRDVERRIEVATSKPLPDLPDMTRPSGIPVDWVEHVKIMFDLQVLAYQADLTRVATFAIAKEGSVMTFPHLGISTQHHEASHHNYDPAKLDDLYRINVDQSELFAYYLDRLDAVKEANGSLLDNSVILFGSTLSNPTVHSQRDLPTMLAGGGGGRLKGGRFIRVKGDRPPWPFAAELPTYSPTPMTNLHLALLDIVGVPTEKLGDSTGSLNLS